MRKNLLTLVVALIAGLLLVDVVAYPHTLLIVGAAAKPPSTTTKVSLPMDVIVNGLQPEGSAIMEIETLEQYNRLGLLNAWVLLLQPIDSCEPSLFSIPQNAATSQKNAITKKIQKAEECKTFVKMFEKCAEDRAGGWNFARLNFTQKVRGKAFHIVDPSVQKKNFHDLNDRQERVAWLGQYICRQYCPSTDNEISKPLLLFYTHLKGKPEVVSETGTGPATHLLKEALELRAKDLVPNHPTGTKGSKRGILKKDIGRQ